MSSGKTANYELNQWTQSDRILMEEFNGDNAKIDAALKALADSNPYRKIVSVVTQAAAQQIDLNVSGIDFTQYYKIELYVDCPAMTSGYSLRINGISTQDYTYNLNYGGGGGSRAYTTQLATILSRGYGVVIFYPPSAAGQVGCMYMSADGTSYTTGQALSSVTWSALRSINIINDAKLPAGTKITLLGVKK